MHSRWMAALARWLPAEAARDWFAPSLADLEAEYLLRRAAAPSRWHRRALACRYVATGTVLYADCLRLAARERLRRRPVDSPSSPEPARNKPAVHQQSSPSRKEYGVMLVRDLRHALRVFRREPGFAAAAVLTIALGIGANTALFAVVEAVLLRPLPLSGAEELVILKHRDVRTGISKEFIAIGDFIDLRARQRALTALAGYGGFQATLMGEGESIRVEGINATPELFDTLRLQPLFGRTFTAADGRQGAPPVVIVSHDLWQNRLGSDPNILSRSIQIGAARRLVVGVAPPGFRFPPHQRTDIIVPAGVPLAAPAERKAGWIFAVGRLQPGMTIEGAAAEFATLSQDFEREYPQSNQGSLYYTVSLRDALVGDTKRPLILMLAAVGFVLLIACANVGNLLLARSLARQHETSMRLALGAGRGRLALQTLTEALVLSLSGGALGVLIAWQAAPALATLMPQGESIPGLDAVRLNGAVLAFSFAASVVSAIVFALVGGVGLTGRGARQALAAPTRVTIGRGARRAASALVVAEIAFAVVLLIGAGLTLRSFSNLISVDPGFEAEGVLTLQLGLPPGRYPNPGARRDLYDRAFAALAALPEIETVGAAAVTPLTGNNWTVPFERMDQPLPRGQRAPDVGWQAASGGYFRALNIPLRAGRLFDSRDTPQTQSVVVIVSEAIANRFFPGESAIGRRVRQGDRDAEIVGVVGDIRRAALTDEPRADMYFPFEQQPPPSVTLFLRTTGDPLQALPAVRSTLRTIEPNVVVYEARTLSDVAAASAAIARLAMRLLTGFAIIALSLAAIGIYGVMSYSVRQRTRELGTRIALGATRGAIVRLVLRQAALIGALGLTMGLVCGLAAARSLSTLLFGVPPWDPVTVAAGVAVLAATTLFASAIPARRASRVDPARTLVVEQ